MKIISEISRLNSELYELQNKFRYYQNKQEHDKRDLVMWDPLDGLTKEQHENLYYVEIWSNRQNLRALQNEIIELRKKIKTIQRKQN